MRRSLRALVTTLATTMAAITLVPAAASADIDLDIRPSAKPKTAVKSWSSGTISPGRTKSWTWNNANPRTSAYHVGLSPVGATTDAPCEFEVTRNWYEQKHSGEREFHFTIKNIGDIACGTNVLLSRLATTSIGSTGGVSPGGIVELNQRDLAWSNNRLVGLTPSGATSNTACKFEVVGASYRRYRSGDVSQFLSTRVAVKNIGSITCTADVRIGSIMIDRNWSTGTLAPGATKYSKWNNANPLTAAHLAGVTPDIGCQLEVVGTYYRQRINSNRSTEREFVLGVKNVGSTACGGEFTFTTI